VPIPAGSRRDLRRRLLDVEGLSTRAAIELQQACRPLVSARWTRREPTTIAGIDVSVRGELAAAAIAVLAFPSLEAVATVTATRPVRFPYVPGLLAFREVPVVLDALACLPTRPEFLMVDGHGYAHPRRFGIACHLAVALDLPGIGVGKTRFIGRHRDPGPRRGSAVRLVDDDEIVGRVVRTRERVRPVYVSVGNAVDLDTAVRITLRCARRFRLPEPIRAAHVAAGLATAR
jgi:deoxyribonuclease V